MSCNFQNEESIMIIDPIDQKNYTLEIKCITYKIKKQKYLATNYE